MSYIKLFIDNFVDAKQHPLYKIFHVLRPYLGISEVVTLSVLNKAFNEVASDVIWSDPPFEDLAYVHDSLYMFNKFLKHLPSVRDSTLRLVRVIDLGKLEESVYERVSPEFFATLVGYCSDLTQLDVSRGDFLSASSLPLNDYWEFPRLTLLNVSYCSRVNDDVLVRIARGCRHLVQVRLDGLSRHQGRGLACFAAECDQLASVSVRYNTAMTDEALITLAKFRHIRLCALDLTGCTKLTSVGFDMLARYCAHLQYVSLAHTACPLEQIKKMTCLERKTTSLDLSGLKHCKPEPLADQISGYQKLEDLTIEMATAIALAKKKTQWHHVKRLVLTQLQEHTPFIYFHCLLERFPNVTRVTFVRAYFESDFLLGMYRTPSPEAEDAITDSKLLSFNLSQHKVIATVIREREDNLDCSLMNW